MSSKDPDLVVRSVVGGLRALRHPAVVKQHRRSLRWKPKNRKAVLIPCSATKPYYESASHKHGYIPGLQGKNVDVFVVSEPMGVIPYAWAGDYPNTAYEFAPKYVRGETRELLVDRIQEWLEKVGPKYDKVYLALPLHHMGMVQDAAEGLDLPLSDVSISACRAQPSCPPTAFRATSEAYRQYLRRRVRNVEGRDPRLGHWTSGPSDPISLGVWADETLEDLDRVMGDPQLKLLLGADAIQLIGRMRDAPRREGPIFKRVRREDIDPQPYENAPEGHFLDARTGSIVVYEDHPDVIKWAEGNPYWSMELPHPEGAFTLGELARLEALLWAISQRLVDERELLSPDQRQLATAVPEAANTLAMILAIHQLDPETSEKMKRTALEIIAKRDENPGPRTQGRGRVQTLKRRLLR